MDYWEAVDLQRHINYDDFRAATADHRLWMLTTRGRTPLWQASFSPGDILLLGPESRGLPADLLATAGDRTLRIPIVPGARSLNLATAAAITLYEALRQVGWGPQNPAGNTPAV